MFQELSEIAAEAVQKKRDKEKKLKLLVGEEMGENGQSKPVQKTINLELTEEDSLEKKATEQ